MLANTAVKENHYPMYRVVTFPTGGMGRHIASKRDARTPLEYIGGNIGCTLPLSSSYIARIW